MSSSPVVGTINAITLNASTSNITEFVATSNQTTFTISYAVGSILVFLNLAIAPILSFTSEETFKYYKNDKDSIFLEEWRDIVIELTENEIKTGKILFNLKEHISRELEDARNNGIIKSSLDAEIELAIDSQSYGVLKEFQTELKFIFITSKFSLIEAKDCLLYTSPSPRDS